MRRRRHAFETTYLREDPTPEPPETPLLLRTKEKDFGATANMMMMIDSFCAVVVVVLSGVKDVTKLRDVIQRKKVQHKGLKERPNESTRLDYGRGLWWWCYKKKGRRHSLVFLSALVSSFVGVVVLSKSSNL